ncbi:leucyl/phenylalanyl-tRNA--protein transferase [Erwinia sp. OLTSP20]|uniref:leucyl/phenylalanyl-tRNA--protein transferase n=1 Tax=unclassified Erwinia TaxID=2622719 RepID=UPI000C1A10DA|nr:MULTISPECIES: leucyl/phenylalanyl-tRNA--protein transferase [unclassified Erwinia]PIJ51300.1 leucyl/phenylalanyl-tRNA--protein transferase [Erwinia sp. OAMSP11]PIJ74085.1 leucyl/phenylalanyl-tRNA--protein transferase [Erwinia sp. OLSSP12]PIJ81191.1 leucyl/phenylalanyl-tRNA--protein transferase [Erwinia sp. OLCASP19]PIJ86048.1 leucyl/phenylalanyl-tRNA--protein transferase [Erwinia sp. OLMTSP26]PIJ87797.1 leucyl/phenylalanyl-tRNA--protein transferase [Erwinia sp. OLMDSP33]
MRLIQLSRDSIQFPPPEMALREPNGLLAMGGDLSPARLLNAYHRGIFPWFSPGDPILWWSPDPRAVLWPDAFRLSRSMKHFHKHSPYQVTLNQAFPDVINGCASGRDEGTWITPEVQRAWIKLWQRGHAHSIDVWQDETLVGGMYGLSLGQIFCGESMFSRRVNASKTALLVFADYFQQQRGRLIDCQVLNPHTQSLGASEIPRARYLTYLDELAGSAVTAGCWQAKRLF